MSEVETNLQPLLDDDTFVDDIVLPKPERRRRGWLVVAIVVLVIVLLTGGGMFTYLKLTAPAPVVYKTATATTGNLSVTVSATGPIEPGAEYDMNFSTSGRVSAIDVHVGQQVKAGQTLATLNSKTLQDAVTSAQHKLSDAQTTYNDAVNVGASQSQLDQDNASITGAQDALQEAEDSFSAATLTAPASATVAAINGVVGQNAGSGGSSSSSSQPFIVLTTMNNLIIQAQVNEADIANVQVNQSATFTVSPYPTQTFQAIVNTIDTVGQTTSNVVTYTVTLGVDEHSLNGAHLYSGMTATVNITTAQRIGTLLVPASALSFTSVAIGNGEISRSALTSLAAGASAQGTSNVQGNRGIVLELKNGQLTPVLVTTGLTNGQYTEILSGLNAGDSVVVSQTGGNTTTTTTGTGTGGGFGGGGGGGGRLRFLGGQ